MAKGYIIGHVTLLDDPESYRPYMEVNNALFPRFGGKFLARGGRAEILEGDCHIRHVIVEFPSYEDALACYNSDEYQKNLKIRQAHAESTILVVEGLD